MVDFPDSPAPEERQRPVSTFQQRQGICTKEQHLDLAPLGKLVAFELIFDLLISLLPLLLLSAHATTHGAGLLKMSGRACGCGNGNEPMRTRNLLANDFQRVRIRFCSRRMIKILDGEIRSRVTFHLAVKLFGPDV